MSKIICTLASIGYVPPLPPELINDKGEEQHPPLFETKIHPEGRPSASLNQGIKCRVKEFIVVPSRGEEMLLSVGRKLRYIREITSREINRNIGMIIQTSDRGKTIREIVSPCVFPTVREPLPIGVLYPHQQRNFIILVVNERLQVITALETGTNTKKLKSGDIAGDPRKLDPETREKFKQTPRNPYPDFYLPLGKGFEKSTPRIAVANLLAGIYSICHPPLWAGSWRPIGDLGFRIPRASGRFKRQVEIGDVSKAWPREMRINIPTDGEVLIDRIQGLAEITAIEEERWRRMRIHQKFGRIIDILTEGYVYHHYKKGREAKGVKAALEVIENAYQYIRKDPCYFGLLIRNEHLLQLLRERGDISEEDWIKYFNKEYNLPPLSELSSYEEKIADTINVKMLRPVNGIQPINIYCRPKRGWRIDQGRGRFRYVPFGGIQRDQLIGFSPEDEDEDDNFMF